MKKLVYSILLICTGLLFLNVDGCNGDNRDNLKRNHAKIQASGDSLKTVFSVENPGVNELNAFEQRAIQNFYEFADYYKICSDSLMAMEFRQQANKMIKNLFESGQCLIYFGVTQSDLKNKISLEKLLSQITVNKFIPVSFGTDTVFITKSLVKEADTLYTGELCWSFPGNQGKGYTKYICTRQPKNFGQKQYFIWTVKFREIICLNSTH
ncbi:MAG: hypothetical protein U0W24_11545 [Bacteroidales bacterium]